ncbi:ABC transporter permease [Petropleomorpha daqingensis]|uniref:ABC-2 type transport system permease protein n=1 Tax=Petropleomorpha daqingensis TaxID=2026353 RepID=A0A853CFH5_9ACTN|nr:ABC-2 type transport system permease protein [Petropleomorpha daqingensis]
MSEPKQLSSTSLIRLVAGREISTRLRDKNFLISTAVLLILIIGVMVFQVLVNSGSSSSTIGVVGSSRNVEQVLVAQGNLQGTDVEVRSLSSEAAARMAVDDGDVDAAVIDPEGSDPRLIVQKSGGSEERLVQGAVAALSTADQLQQANVALEPPPTVAVVPLEPGGEDRTQATVVAIVGVGLLYFLLILFGQFVAQGVVEEKSSRVVELLLATMKPWQLLAGKILGLGLLGLGQIVILGVVGTAGAIAFDVVDVPGQVIGTVVSVVLWFVIGYALYASIFAVAASLVSRQEDLGSVLTPTTILLVVGFVIAIQAAGDPTSTLATVTSFVPGLSPLVMPVRMAAGAAQWWEVVVAVALMLVAIGLIVRLGGRVYAGALLRTGGKIKMREALQAERA